MKRLLIPTLVLAALALAACSGSSAPDGETAITVEASALKYQPATIEVVAGQTVKLIFDNQDSVDHDLSVMEFPVAAMAGGGDPMAGHDMSGMAEEPDLHMVAAMGARSELEFTPSQPGTYEFFCTVPGHKEAGMVGTLVVRAP